MKDKDLELKLNAETNKTLDQANQTSTFDSVFLQVMGKELEAYSNELKTLYGTTSNTAAKKILKDDFDQTQLLREQLPTSTTVEAPTTP